MGRRKAMTMAACIGAGILLVTLSGAGQSSVGESGAPRIETTLVDGAATGYGTFQSHNQKVIANARGVFMTHIRSRNEPYTAQTWRLSWSRDGGKTFVTLHEATHATNPPVLETDAERNLYLVRVDFTQGDAYLYRFMSADDYTAPKITRIPRGAAGKYALYYDSGRRRLYYFAHNNTFHVLDRNGAVLRSCDLLRPGKNAVLQYPLLSLDAAGTLYAAWTTQKHGVYLYWDIHCIRSRDGGETWEKLDRTPLTVPIVADDTGPSDRISGDDEFEVHTWLSSFLARDGKLHFLYLAQSVPPRQHYVRYDIRTGRRDIDRSPRFEGEKIRLQGLDGFFAARTARGDPLFAVGHAGGGRIGCLASDDKGATWRDHALSEPFDAPYAVGGCRAITPDGHVIGSFTARAASDSAPEGISQVHFLKIRAALARPR